MMSSSYVHYNCYLDVSFVTLTMTILERLFEQPLTDFNSAEFYEFKQQLEDRVRSKSISVTDVYIPTVLPYKCFFKNNIY